jgi:non-ribosomal peptide synthetase component F
MYAGFLAWLNRYSGETDLCVGSGFANRRPEVEHLLGMFVNTVVLRCPVDPRRPFTDLLSRAHAEVVGATENQEFPFVPLVRRLRPDRDLSYNPFFQVMFSFHDAPAARLDFAGAPARVFEHANGSAKTDLNVIVIPRADAAEPGRTGESLTVLWEYSSDLFDPSTAERMIAQYLGLLDAVTQAPRTPVWQLSLVTAAVRG